MGAERVARTRSIIDVLDHVIDKGIVVDAWVRLSAAGIDLLATRARIVVESIATSLNLRCITERRRSSALKKAQDLIARVYLFASRTCATNRST